MALAEFAGIDFGFENDDGDDYRAFYRSTRSSIQVARTLFAFPGADGVWVQRHGKRGRPIVWIIELLFDSLVTRETWEEAIEAKLDDKTYTMTLNGRDYASCQLMNFHEIAAPEGCSQPFVGRAFYLLEFLQLTP